MQLGELLVRVGLVTSIEIDQALRRQKANGERLGENLVAMGVISKEQLASVVNSMPKAPSLATETGISTRSLLNLLLKLMHTETLTTVSELSERIKLSPRIVQTLLDDAAQQRFIQAVGSAPHSAAFSTSYALSEQGKTAARDALDQNLYVGPAPVSLAAYQQQIEKQRITNELLDEVVLRQGFEGLVVPDHYFEKLLPAINARKSVLLFGPPGNGKTTMATRVADLFRDVVYIPYAIEVNGQIITIYDSRLHKPAISQADDFGLPMEAAIVERDRLDERWVACRRPAAIAGGELTLDMLDLRYNPDSKFYDAPLHVKALNGMLLIDDFGRQAFDPSKLLNRWIVPMENRIDYLKLNSGTSFSLPFDELVIFSTNLTPSDLMDSAFLRRIPYKIKLSSPSRGEYWDIFNAVASTYDLVLTQPIFDIIVSRLDVQFGLAYYQPKFICQQVLEVSRSFGKRSELTKEAVLAALRNLYYEIEDGADVSAAPAPALVSFA